MKYPKRRNKLQEKITKGDLYCDLNDLLSHMKGARKSTRLIQKLSDRLNKDPAEVELLLDELIEELMMVI
jgi:hypothetical protein